jgi:hypothetical protein
MAGVAGIARDRARRVRPIRAAAAGVNEQTRPEPGTAISVRRSPDFLARIETIVGTVAGVVAVAAVDSPNCIATPVYPCVVEATILPVLPSASVN